MTPRIPSTRRPSRRRLPSVAGWLLLGCLGAAPAPDAAPPAGPPPALDALAGRPSNRFT